MIPSTYVTHITHSPQQKEDSVTIGGFWRPIILLSIEFNQYLQALFYVFGIQQQGEAPTLMRLTF